jgi:hypothetical protein
VNARKAEWRRAALAVVLVGVLIGGIIVMRTLAKRPVAGPPPVTIAVVGDSYSAGHNNQVVWPTLLAQRTGWSVANFAQPDAGFAVDMQGGHAFSYQVQRAAQVHPRAIVIMSGTADVTAAYSGAIDATAADALQRIQLTGAEAFVIGPTWYGTDIPEALRILSNEIHKAADTAGVPFLDALNPPWLTIDQMQADLGGATDAGQSVIADKVAAWLRSEVTQ